MESGRLKSRLNYSKVKDKLNASKVEFVLI